MYSKPTAAVGCPCTWHNELANDWAPLNSILANGHRFYRTPSNPLCLPEKLIWKHAPLKSEHEIYRSMWGLNPGFSDRTSRSVCTVSQPTEPLRQACHMCVLSQIFEHTDHDFTGKYRTLYKCACIYIYVTECLCYWVFILTNKCLWTEDNILMNCLWLFACYYCLSIVKFLNYMLIYQYGVLFQPDDRGTVKLHSLFCAGNIYGKSVYCIM